MSIESVFMSLFSKIVGIDKKIAKRSEFVIKFFLKKD